MYTIQDVKNLVSQLNKYCDSYYSKNESLISDKEYDILFDRLVEMEQETGIVLSNSPTVCVGYKVASDLPKVKHQFPPMLSLDKSKDLKEMKKFLEDKPALVMAKMDGLTIRITYRDGAIYRAETRGDGDVGEDVTHNIHVVKDVPITLPIFDEIIVDGEVIVTRDTFARLREKFVDNKGKKYKNPRNFAAGSIRLHDPSKTAERGLQFVAWKFVKGSEYKYFSSRLNHLEELGFNTTPYFELTGSMNESNYEVATADIQAICDTYNYPIDGCVFSFNDCAYMDLLGFTSHHSRAQIAYKFYDEKYDTVIRDIDWTMGKTGALTPTAVFDTVEIDGTDVSRASLHNLTIMKQLNVRKDCTARVFKANMIIPQVDSVDDDGVDDFIIPDTCPICGGFTERIQENDSEVLMCMNPQCRGKLLGKLCTFVSKQGMDIDGLGENSLELYINLNLLNSFVDIYDLKNHVDFLKNLEGKGDTSIDNMLKAIEKSKSVSCEKFLASLSIPNIGLTSAKTIANHFDYDINKILDAAENRYSWSNIDGFGEKTEQAINDWFSANMSEFKELLNIVRIKVTAKRENVTVDSPVSGKTFCITGSFGWGKREEIKTRLEALGAISVECVTKKTQILFAGDKAGSKLKKAQDLDIVIYDETALIDLIGE